MEKQLCYNKALELEVRHLKGDVGPIPPGPGRPVLPMLPVRSLTLGMTGGSDSGSCPGDSALQVTLEPRDCDNHVVKVPGAARIIVLEISSEGTKKPLSEWDVSPEQLRKAWGKRLFGSGYTLILDWKVYPSTTKLRVIAKFLAADGREFEAEKDITIKLVPIDKRKLPEPAGTRTGPEEDPFLPSNPSNPNPPLPKKLGDPANPEKLPKPAPLDLGPQLPEPTPPESPSSDTSSWGRPITGRTESTSGWGGPRPWQTESPSSWGGPISRPGASPVPLDTPVWIGAPQPLPPGW